MIWWRDAQRLCHRAASGAAADRHCPVWRMTLIGGSGGRAGRLVRAMSGPWRMVRGPTEGAAVAAGDGARHGKSQRESYGASLAKPKRYRLKRNDMAKGMAKGTIPGAMHSAGVDMPNFLAFPPK